ncbi:hypothetical protein ACU4GG_39730 [Streptomyces nojiriensis]
MVSAGSARPDAVRAVLNTQREAYEQLRADWRTRAAALRAGAAEGDRALYGAPDDTIHEEDGDGTRTRVQHAH